MNRLRVLDAVREHGALTQVEIAGVTGLSAATVSNLVKELDTAGAVQLTPSIRNGRRAVQVSVAASHGLVAAIVFGDRDVRVALGTGGSEILSQRRMPLPADHAADEGMSRAARLVLELVDQSGHSTSEIRAVGLGLPGAHRHRLGRRSGRRASSRAGAASPSPTRWPRPSAPRSLLDNTANLAALGEAEVRCAAGCLERRLHQGSPTASVPGSSSAASCSAAAPGTAGEIGHVTIDEDGPVCRCGNRGCLDTFVGSQALLDALRDSPRRADPARRHLARARGRPRLPAGARGLGPAHRRRGRGPGQPAQPRGGRASAARCPGWARSSSEPMREALERCAIPSAAASVRGAGRRPDPEEADVLGALAIADQVREDADRAALTVG